MSTDSRVRIGTVSADNHSTQEGTIAAEWTCWTRDAMNLNSRLVARAIRARERARSKGQWDQFDYLTDHACIIILLHFLVTLPGTTLQAVRNGYKSGQHQNWTAAITSHPRAYYDGTAFHRGSGANVLRADDPCAVLPNGTSRIRRIAFLTSSGAQVAW